MPEPGIDQLLRQLAPGLLGALVRRYQSFDDAEDAMQEAMIAASLQWPEQGIPESPAGWLYTVAARRLTDHWRSEAARRNREAKTILQIPHAELSEPAIDTDHLQETDDTLALLFMCCHPALSASSQVALTLRAVGGLTTAEIARAFFVPEATMAQRISRAKASIKFSGIPIRMPPATEWDDRLISLLHVLYLIFNEGYTASSGAVLGRADLTTEAIRITRMVRELLPDDGEVAGLLALMILTDARRPARVDADGCLIPLAEQDRTRWNQDFITEGIDLISETLARARIGPYQLQAAIAAVHDEAAEAADTEWAQILALYGLLDRVAPSPTVTLNRAVAVAMVHGPAAGLNLLDTLTPNPQIVNHHRVHAVRAHLQEMAGDYEAARQSYRTAAERTPTIPEQHYLKRRSARLRSRPCSHADRDVP